MAGKSQSADALYKQLKNPFDPKFIKVRVGATNRDKTKGIALFYLDVREVRKRLTEVCGLDGWQSETKAITAGNEFIGATCKMGIRMPDGSWVWHEDAGEPAKGGNKVKAAFSDAIKRAAVNFGVGAYLYYIPNRWYDLKANGNNFDEQPSLPEWAKPSSNIEDWVAVAEMEYNPDEDVDIENGDVVFVDPEAEEILKVSAEKKAEILAKLKAKQND